MTFDAERRDHELVDESRWPGPSRGIHWREIDRHLRRIARRRAEVDAEEARWLLAAHRGGVHRALGHATFVEYIEHVLGHGPRATLDRLRVAEALESLPAMSRALAGAELSYSAVRELTRVATAATEREWLEAASGKTVRQVEELVSGHAPGDLPADPAAPDLRRQILRFEVSPETRALLRDAERVLSIEAGHMLDDDELIAAMCRAVLAPTGAHAAASTQAQEAREVAASGPRYQIAIMRCDGCGRGWQDGAGRAIAIDPAALETASCDALVIGRIDRGAKAGEATARGRKTSQHERATRTIPPATRRKVLRRDHGRCVVTGCRSTRWIDVHHLIPRAEGGSHDADNLACLCGAHHRAVHDGRLRITGRPGAFACFHGDGRRWGAAPAIRTTDDTAVRGSAADPETARLARGALQTLGYSAGEAGAAVGRARAHVGAGEGVEAWIRAALRMCRRT